MITTHNIDDVVTERLMAAADAHAEELYGYYEPTPAEEMESELYTVDGLSLTDARRAAEAMAIAHELRAERAAGARKLAEAIEVAENEYHDWRGLGAVTADDMSAVYV